MTTEPQITKPEDSTSEQSEPQKKNRLFLFTKKAGTVYIIIVIAILSFSIGTQVDQTAASASSNNAEIDFTSFWTVWNKVNKKFVDRPLNQRTLLYGAIKGMVEATDDPYSQFLTPEETKVFTSQIEGKFEGIGAEIGIQDDILTIISPLPGSPAEQAGAKPQDKIIKIDETDTAGMSTDEAVGIIRGPKGTIVSLTIIRTTDNESSGQEEKILTITRDTISIKSVELGETVDNIAHIELRSFGTDTVKEFNTFANSLTDSDVQGIVIDVRNNPGGLLDVSVNIASLFLSKGDVVLIEDMGDGKRKEHTAGGNNKLQHIPVAVLINEGSASASEILAGALRDNIGSFLVGKKSFGKGSVQDYEQIEVGEDTTASLRVTIAKWLTPNGISIHENGLEPDIEIDYPDNTDSSNDPQLERARQYLQDQ